MVGVAKWLRQWVVVPSCAGSNPVAHPQLYSKKLFYFFSFFSCKIIIELDIMF